MLSYSHPSPAFSEAPLIEKCSQTFAELKFFPSIIVQDCLKSAGEGYDGWRTSCHEAMIDIYSRQSTSTAHVDLAGHKTLMARMAITNCPSRSCHSCPVAKHKVCGSRIHGDCSIINGTYRVIHITRSRACNRTCSTAQPGDSTQPHKCPSTRAQAAGGECVW